VRPYKNVNGSSGVIAYETGTDFIKVRFTDGTIYHYSYQKPGKQHVERMKKRASAGKGLSTYISQFVREKYERKY
jgi:hypothetical protein